MQSEHSAPENMIKEQARALLAQGVSAADFSRAFFGPEGQLRTLWHDPDERKALVDSDLYRWLKEQLGELRRSEVAHFEQEVESLSGRVTITVPKSLHAALKREAKQEGVSLSELMRLKLAVEYRSSVQRMARDKRRPRRPSSC